MTLSGTFFQTASLQRSAAQLFWAALGIVCVYLIWVLVLGNYRDVLSLDQTSQEITHTSK